MQLFKIKIEYKVNSVNFKSIRYINMNINVAFLKEFKT